MPILMPKAPVAHALPVFGAMLSIVAAHPRFSLSGCAGRVDSSTKFLTRRCSGSASPPTELHTLDHKKPLEIRVHSFNSLLLVVFLLAACADERMTVLRSDDGETSLSYQCSKFQAKAETTSEAMVLFKYAAQIQTELLAAGQNVTAFEFGKVAQNDMRELERYIVRYQCELRR